MNKALQKPKVVETFAKLGATPAGGTADAFGSLIKEQVAHWGKVIRRVRDQDATIGPRNRREAGHGRGLDLTRRRHCPCQLLALF